MRNWVRNKIPKYLFTLDLTKTKINMTKLIDQLKLQSNFNLLLEALDDESILDAICLLLPQNSKLIEIIGLDYEAGFIISLPEELPWEMKLWDEWVQRVQNLNYSFGRYIRANREELKTEIAKDEFYDEHWSLNIKVQKMDEGLIRISFYSDDSTY